MTDPIENSQNLTMDEAYIQKLKMISLNGQGESDPRYGRIGNKAEPAVPTYHQKQRSIGAIETFAAEGSPQKNPSPYTMYERGNVIVSSKFATPKQVETIASQNLTSEENDVYVQCAKPQTAIPASPLGSPRASVAPVYENIDYYGAKSAQPVYYHQKNQAEPIYRKAQPQVPTGNKHASLRQSDSLPVYENIQELSQKSSGAMPGPQVPYSQAPPPYPAQNYSNYAQRPVAYSALQSPRANKVYPQSTKFTQQQLDEINASDYVCMTGNISHTLSTNTPFQTTSAKNYERTPATGIAGAPTKPVKEPKKSPEKAEARPPPAPSPTPSTCSNSSGKLKFSGKNLLPYNVTPPRPRGPTEAERKIEEMTRQIEEEMEKHEEEGEYFGMLRKFCFKFYVLF